MHLDDLSAEARRYLRQVALAGVPYPLFDTTENEFGPPILPLTPRHHLLLLLYRNPVFCGGERPLAAVLQYVWLCSPQFRVIEERALAFRALRFRLFARRWKRSLAKSGQPSVRALAALDIHAAGMLMDRPAMPVEKGVGQPPPSNRDAPHELLSLESACRRYLGYTRAEFWHTPYVTTNGLLSLQFSASTPDMPRFDHARDKLLGNRLRERVRALRETQTRN